MGLLGEGLDRPPLERAEMGLSSQMLLPEPLLPGCRALPVLAREELGALRRRAGLPRSPLRGTIHAASDILGRRAT